MLEDVTSNGLRLICAPSLESECGARIAFSTREGGVSIHPFDGLNLSFNVGDERGAVLENRALLARAAGMQLSRWVVGRQVHGVGCREAGVVDRGRGARDPASALPRTDALLTRQGGVVTAVLTADCVPLLMVAPGGKGVAAVHAGWRGVYAGIGNHALARLTRMSGCAAPEILVFVGPHIRSCCMEVDEELASRFAARFGPGCCVELDSGPGLDLEAALIADLTGRGLEAGNIFSAGMCTVCDGRFFSHRREAGETGRQASLAVISDRTEV